MKKLIWLCFILISACGGGSQDQEIIKDPPPVEIKESKIYEYSLKKDGETRSYNGRCLEINEIYYCYPKTIANSDFVVTAKIDGDNIQLFSFISRAKTLELNNAAGYAFTLSEIGKASKDTINGQWFNRAYSGQFGDAIISATYNDGVIQATDTKGCFINGKIEPFIDIYQMNLTIENCVDSGQYVGAIQSDDGFISGAVFSDNKSLFLDFSL